MKVNSTELYRLLRQHTDYVNFWYDDIVKEALAEIVRVGYYPPRAYALSWMPNMKEYKTTNIALEEDCLSNQESRESTLVALSNVENAIPGQFIGFVLASEGTSPVLNSDQRNSFLIITFEDRVKGWKRVYRVNKVNVMNEKGALNMVVKDLIFDEDSTYSRDIKILERVTHILRPNYSNRLDIVYN